MNLRELPLGIRNTLLLWRTGNVREFMSPPQLWNLGHHSQWLATVGVLTPSSFISQLDKLWHVIYTPELPMGSGWGWDVLDFFLFLIPSFPSFAAVSWGHLLNKSLPFKPLAMGRLLGEPDLDRWPNVRTCHSHRRDLCYRHGRSRHSSKQAWKQS